MIVFILIEQRLVYLKMADLSRLSRKLPYEKLQLNRQNNEFLTYWRKLEAMVPKGREALRHARLLFISEMEMPEV